MNSQNLLKLLAVLSLVATVAIWRTAGAAPSPWLVRLSVGLFGTALLVGLITPATRPRLMLRFLAALFALVAVIALAADFSHAGGFTSTALMKHWSDLAPSLLNIVKSMLLHSPVPFLWQPVLTHLLALPTYLIFAVLALLAGFAGRPRHQIQIFVN